MLEQLLGCGLSVWQEEKEENSFLGALGQRKGPVWAEARMYFCCAFAIPRLKPGVIRIGSFVEWRFAPRYSVWQEEKEENSFLGALGQRKGPVWAEARTLIKKRLSPKAKACGNARLKEFANQKKLL